MSGGFELQNQIRHCKTICIKRNLYLINYNLREHSELQMEIKTPVLLAYAIEDSTDIFRISGGFEHPKLPSRYATVSYRSVCILYINLYITYIPYSSPMSTSGIVIQYTDEAVNPLTHKNAA